MDFEREGRRRDGLCGVEPHLVHLLTWNSERDILPHHRPSSGAGHGVPGYRRGDVCARREARPREEIRIYRSRGAGCAVCQSRSRRALQPDQGDHLRSAPRGGADAGAVGGARGLDAAAKGVCAAGAAPGWRRCGELGAGNGPGRAQGAAGLEERVVAGDERQVAGFRA